MNALRCFTSSAASSAMDFWRVVVEGVMLVSVVVAEETCDPALLEFVWVVVSEISGLRSSAENPGGNKEARNVPVTGVPALLFEVKLLNLCIAFICEDSS